MQLSNLLFDAHALPRLAPRLLDLRSRYARSSPYGAWRHADPLPLHRQPLSPLHLVFDKRCLTRCRVKDVTALRSKALQVRCNV